MNASPAVRSLPEYLPAAFSGRKRPPFGTRRMIGGSSGKCASRRAIATESQKTELNDPTCFDRRNVSKILLLLLGDEYMCYKVTAAFSRNREIPISLRAVFGFQLEKSAEWIEAVTDRIRELRTGPNASWMDFIKTARHSLAPIESPPTENFLCEISRFHHRLIAQLHSDIDACLQLYQDPATAGFLAGLKEQHERAAWALRTQFQSVG